MKIPSVLRRGTLVAAAMAVVGGSGALAIGVSPAGASNVEVTAAGSATTYVMMHKLFPTSLNDLYPGGMTTKQKIQTTTGLCNGGTSYTTHTTFPKGAPNGSTAGRTALKTEESALATRKGCIDFARSSAPPKGSGTLSAHFDYYAYALTGVGIVTGANAGGNKATPVTISITQLRAVYRCYNGTTLVDTWAQLGISASTTVINRFWPQAGSGTRSVMKDIIGFTPDPTGTHTTWKTSRCTATTNQASHITPPLKNAFTQFSVANGGAVNEENSEEGMLYSNSLPVTNPTHYALANDFFIYSAGKFSSEWDTYTNYSAAHTNSEAKTHPNTVGNFVRTGGTGRRLIFDQTQNRSTHLGNKLVSYSPTTATPHPTGLFSINGQVVKEANEWYHLIPTNGSAATASTSPVMGIRYLYNVADTALPSYGEAKMMIGFDNQATGTPSTLCHGDDASIISASGFLPLNNNGSNTAPTGSDVSHANCREFPSLSYPGLGTAKVWHKNTWVQATF